MGEAQGSPKYAPVPSPYLNLWPLSTAMVAVFLTSGTPATEFSPAAVERIAAWQRSAIQRICTPMMCTGDWPTAKQCHYWIP